MGEKRTCIPMELSMDKALEALSGLEKDGRADITKEGLAKRSGLTVGRLRHSLKRLEDQGFISIERRTAPEGGGYIWNEYALTEKGRERLREKREADE